MVQTNELFNLFWNWIFTFIQIKLFLLIYIMLKFQEIKKGQSKFMFEN